LPQSLKLQSEEENSRLPKLTLYNKPQKQTHQLKVKHPLTHPSKVKHPLKTLKYPLKHPLKTLKQEIAKNWKNSALRDATINAVTRKRTAMTTLRKRNAVVKDTVSGLLINVNQDALHAVELVKKKVHAPLVLKPRTMVKLATNSQKQKKVMRKRPLKPNPNPLNNKPLNNKPLNNKPLNNKPLNPNNKPPRDTTTEPDELFIFTNIKYDFISSRLV
jgi:hypothetical protein